MEGSHIDTGTVIPMRSPTTSVDGWVRRLIASGLVALFTVPIAVAQPVQPTRPTAGQQQNTPASPDPSQGQSAPTSTTGTSKPPSAAARSVEAPTDNTSSTTPQAAVTNQESRSSPPSAPEPQQKAAPKEPVGTAAAPLEKTTGIAASRPAGAAVAPAKQRRARSILIKLGFVLGAAVAVGTVVALSKGSPSTPN